MKEFYKFSRVTVALIALAFSLPLTSSAQRTLTARPNVIVDSFTHGFYESLPASYAANPNKKYPLLVFIHGIGEIGNGSASQLPYVLRDGPIKQLDQQINQKLNANFPDPVVVNGQRFEFIVIAPQLNTWPWNVYEQIAVNDMINYAIAHYRVDTSKMYLTGMSMGGGISWEYPGFSANMYGKRLAGLLVVAGASSPSSERAAEIAKAHLPVWATANSSDPTVPTSYTTDYINLLKAAGANPAPIYTIFPETGHGGWLKTYGAAGQPGVVQNGLNVYQWMLQYKRVGDNVVIDNAGTSVFTVNAGPDVTITLPTNNVQLTGTATVQGETISGTSWREVSGPNTATIANGGTITPTISGVIAGTYVFEVTLKSASGKTVTDQMILTVNPAPVFTVNAGPDQTITLPTNSIQLTGTATVQGETISSTSWREVSGPNTATIANGGTITPTISGVIAGTYVFEVTLKSASGKTVTDQMILTVNPAPQTSVFTVSAGPDVSVTLPVNSVKLAGVATVKSETIKTCRWVQVSGPNTAVISGGGSITPTVSGLTGGTYTFQVELTSVSGKTAADQANVVVTPLATGTFIVNAGPDVSITLPVNSWKIMGTATVKAQTVATCQWTQVSGPSTATWGADRGSIQPSVGALVAGSYTFRVTIVSTTGATSSDQMVITVKPVGSSVAVATLSGIADSLDVSEPRFKLYPNPVASGQQLQVECKGLNAGAVKFTLYDISGKLVKQVVADNQSSYLLQSIPITGLVKGVYILTLTQGNDKLTQFKVIVE